MSLQEALERAWSRTRSRHWDVPGARIILTTRSTRLPHLIGEQWRQPDGEWCGTLLVPVSALTSADAVLTWLLHQAAHGLAALRGITETSRQGRYHNTAYAELAVEVGLRVKPHPTWGHHTPGLTAQTRRDYDLVWWDITTALNAERNTLAAAQAKTTRQDTNLAVAVCGCTPPRRIRVARGVLAAPDYPAEPILCGRCHQPFHPS